MQLPILTIVVISTVFVASEAMRLQSVGARGKVMCGSRPDVGAKIKLYDEDDGPDPDDLLAEMVVGSDGNFEVSGSTRELTPIDPVLKIYTDCNDGIRPCQRKIRMTLPNRYINSGGHVTNWYEAGTLNVEGKYRDEERDCVHRRFRSLIDDYDN